MCWFTHHWTKWSKVFETKKYLYHSSDRSTTETKTFAQERFCIDCNIREVRETRGI